jgi:hypothetical protein
MNALRAPTQVRDARREASLRAMGPRFAVTRSRRLCAKMWTQRSGRPDPKLLGHLEPRRSLWCLLPRVRVCVDAVPSAKHWIGW